MCSITAHASASPSYVAVPRPISSSTTRLRDVAVFRITAVSVISTMNVDRPRARLSAAPMRVNTRSTMLSVAESAGTNDPICARITIAAACRRYVDLPPMFGPSDHRDELRLGVEIKIVGDEAQRLFFGQLLDHRMPAGHDPNLARIGKRGRT